MQQHTGAGKVSAWRICPGRENVKSKQLRRSVEDSSEGSIHGACAVSIHRHPMFVRCVTVQMLLGDARGKES